MKGFRGIVLILATFPAVFPCIGASKGAGPMGLPIGMPSEAGGFMSDSPPIPRGQRLKEVPPGAWGGNHISLDVTETGARIEFDCAHGEITGKIVLYRPGRFSAAGDYVEEHGGPIREADEGKSVPVIYSGQITGKTMKLTVRRQRDKRLIGAFTLIRGQEAFIVKCR
ncbi:MAG: hypothetical protein ACKVX9_14210 [Blastocatellia bacterium]